MTNLPKAMYEISNGGMHGASGLKLLTAAAPNEDPIPVAEAVPCLHVRRYASGRIANQVCTLPAGHTPVERHSNGRLRWTERVLVWSNRKDRRG